MTATETTPRIEPDARVRLHGNWDDYERLLTMRGESAAVRITYIEGEIELMSPSNSHEWIKKLITRLLEAWADDCEVDLNGYGYLFLREPLARVHARAIASAPTSAWAGRAR